MVWPYRDEVKATPPRSLGKLYRRPGETMTWEYVMADVENKTVTLRGPGNCLSTMTISNDELKYRWVAC